MYNNRFRDPEYIPEYIWDEYKNIIAKSAELRKQKVTAINPWKILSQEAGNLPKRLEVAALTEIRIDMDAILGENINGKIASTNIRILAGFGKKEVKSGIDSIKEIGKRTKDVWAVKTAESYRLAFAR